eukprot:154411_1
MVRLFSGITINNTNKGSDLFYIGFKIFVIQNWMICEMLLYMENLMQHEIQYFSWTIGHQCIMFNQLFDMYNILAVENTHTVRLYFGEVTNEHEIKELFKVNLYFCQLDIGYLLKVYFRILYQLVVYCTKTYLKGSCIDFVYNC